MLKYADLDSFYVPLPKAVFADRPMNDIPFFHNNWEKEDAYVVAVNAGFEKGFTIIKPMFEAMPDVSSHFGSI